MNIAEHRKEFVVFVVDADFSAGESSAAALRALGYEAKVFPTADSALAAARVAPPHIVFFNLGALEVIADHFLGGLAEISGEILSVLAISAGQKLSAVQYVGQGLAFDYLVYPMATTLELAQAVDRAARQLFFQFENEQLLERVGRNAPAAPEQSQTQEDRQDLAGGGEIESARSAGAASALVELNEFQARLAATKDLEPAAQAFMEAISRRLGGAPSIYFKYLPQHLALAVAQSSWLPIEKIRGIGIDLKEEGPARAQEMLAHPESIAALRALLGQAFRLEKYMAFPHMLDGEPIGIFVVFAEALGAAATEAMLALRLAFECAYKRNQLLKEKHLLDVYDSGTGLLSRRGFSAEIDKEIVRARRIMLPLSLACLSVDAFSPGDDSKASRGKADAVVKVIAAILKKTARVNDFIGRTGPTELMFLLPHTDGMGAAIKGERARRAVESMRFPPFDRLGPVTVSVGVGEYPSTCGDADGLLKSADEALWQVRRAGGNKVCLGTPTEGHVPDFATKSSPAELAATWAGDAGKPAPRSASGGA